MITNNETVLPFLKWAGGKRWLAQKYPDVFNVDFGTYIEPFLGSGSIFFYLQPKKAILADKNKDLIDTYIEVKNNWSAVYQQLMKHQKNHTKKYYYKTRQKTPLGRSAKAAWFIYLNSTCWNGLYRVNLNGVFNVPIGTKLRVPFTREDLEKTSNLLKHANLYCEDFEKTINRSKKDDLVFADPPYTVKHNNNNFVKYNETLFSWSDQIRLSACLNMVAKNGVKVILTNACHKEVKVLYSTMFTKTVNRRSVISGLSSGRGVYEELLIRSFR